MLGAIPNAFVTRTVLPLLFCYAVAAQGPGRATAPADPSPENARQGAVTFRSRTNLVLVPVVVRDRAGHTVGTLKQNNFRLFDKGHPQEITTFSVEGSGRIRGSAIDASAPADRQPDAPISGLAAAPAAANPQRFIVYLVDDLHLAVDDLPRVRNAAIRHLGGMQTGDHAAVYTASGRVMLDLTTQPDDLRQAFDRLRPTDGAGMTDCMDLNDYLADLVDREDRQAIAAAVEKVRVCEQVQTSTGLTLAIKSAARQKLYESRRDARMLLAMLRRAVMLLSAAPGQRTVVLISAGFMLREERFDASDVFNAAARAGVVVNALNSRGLVAYAPMNCPASDSCVGRPLQGQRNFDREADSVHDEALAEIAQATGGTYFHNNNDYFGGFQRLAGAPEFYYVLGFSPRAGQLDDRFHPLKVTLVNGRGLDATARQGYYASSREPTPEETAAQEMEEALYSRAGLPGSFSFDLRTRINPASNGKGALEISALLDPRDLHMHRQDGVSRKALTVAFGLFNARGTLLAITRKEVGLQIRDLDMEKMSGRWVAVKATFPAEPGDYSIRVIVQDAEEHRLAVATGAVHGSKQDL